MENKTSERILSVKNQRLQIGKVANCSNYLQSAALWQNRALNIKGHGAFLPSIACNQQANNMLNMVTQQHCLRRLTQPCHHKVFGLCFAILSKRTKGYNLRVDTAF